VTYEIWNNKTGNVIDEFDDEASALAFVRETVALRGVTAVADWSLDGPDRTLPPLYGRALLARAQVRISA
jgi:hypothetical protein